MRGDVERRKPLYLISKLDVNVQYSELMSRNDPTRCNTRANLHNRCVKVKTMGYLGKLEQNRGVWQTPRFCLVEIQFCLSCDVHHGGAFFRSFGVVTVLHNRVGHVLTYNFALPAVFG